MKKFRTIMIALPLAVIMISFLMTSCGNSVENQKKTETDKNLGEKLVKNVWENFKNKQYDSLEKMMANEFQSVHDFGAKNKDEELQLIKGLDISSYVLSDINITQNGSVIVTTYKVSVEETINGERLSKDPASRLSVFAEIAGKWKWIAHANLKPVIKKEEKPVENTEK